MYTCNNECDDVSLYSEHAKNMLKNITILPLYPSLPVQQVPKTTYISS